MPDYILIKNPQSNTWQRAAEQDLPDEKALQKLVKEYPETLPAEFQQFADVMAWVAEELRTGRGSQSR